METLKNWFWKFVFWWKKRTGLVDFEKEITVDGIVVSLQSDEDDGDRSFDLGVEQEDFKWVGIGDRFTREGRLHCEVVPWSSPKLKGVLDSLKIGDAVRVTGSWVFDGVHTGRSLWKEVLLALWRHQPNFKDGWFEIHPVKEIQKT